MNLMMEKNVPTPDNSPGLAQTITSDVHALVSRLFSVRADIDVLLNLAQGVSMTVDAALPAPAPPAGDTSGDVVTVGSTSEEA
ncbi:hypothetical protein [Nocardia sp. NPDC127526]|uniref:hypothetical protein n=1 Tax=Nocardia sp. NPDC127526 TaxID=3345393 RepID=UPI00363FEDB0